MAKNGINNGKSIRKKIFVLLLIATNLLTWIPFIFFITWDSFTWMKGDFASGLVAAFWALLISPFHSFWIYLLGLILNVFFIYLQRKNRFSFLVSAGIIICMVGAFFWGISLYDAFYDPTPKAIKNGDYSVCNSITNPMRMDDQTNCIMQVAIDLNDINGCKKIKDIYLNTKCMGHIAKNTGNVSVCDDLQEENYKQICINQAAYR